MSGSIHSLVFESHLAAFVVGEHGNSEKGDRRRHYLTTVANDGHRVNSSRERYKGIPPVDNVLVLVLCHLFGPYKNRDTPPRTLDRHICVRMGGMIKNWMDLTCSLHFQSTKPPHNGHVGSKIQTQHHQKNIVCLRVSRVRLCAEHAGLNT